MTFAIDKSQLNSNETIAVALSGGKDSVFLLYQLFELQKKLGFKLCAVNVDHGIRGDESKQNSKFCRQLANSLNIPFKGYEIDAVTFSSDNGYTLEQGARILRYNCFFDAIESGFCNKIATAHHKNDLCETLLFNLFRGSGLRGAKISSIAFGEKIIRPILNVSRQEIDAYITQNNIAYVHDKTNDDNSYSRNYIRNKVIPVITDKFENAIDSIYRFSEYARRDDEFLYKLAQESISITNDAVNIPATSEKPILSRAIVLALNHLGVSKDYTSRHIDSVISLCHNQSGAKVDLLGGIIAIKCGDFIQLKANKQADEFCFPYAVNSFQISNGKIVLEKVKTCDLSSYKQTLNNKVLFFDGDKIPSDAVIRTKLDGDIFTKFGGGTKSLKKYLTDKKIYTEQRAKLPLIAVKNEILCIFGVEISDKIKLSPQTTNIIKAIFIEN